MAIDTYAELQTSIASWIHRKDLTAQIPDFIALAEARIKTMLSTRQQSIVTTLSTVANSPIVAAPTGLRQFRSLTIKGVIPTIEYLAPDQFNRQHSNTIVGIPTNYTIIGDNIYFGPTPDKAYSVDATYEVELTPLSDASPTSPLLTRWPNIYLWGALVEATKYTKDKAAQDNWEAEFQTSIAGVNLLDWHSGGSMRVRTDVRP